MRFGSVKQVCLNKLGIYKESRSYFLGEIKGWRKKGSSVLKAEEACEKRKLTFGTEEEVGAMYEPRYLALESGERGESSAEGSGVD